jgi:hypothetical protein
MSSSYADASRAGRRVGEARHTLSSRAPLCVLLVLAAAQSARAQEAAAATPVEQPKAALLSTAGASGSQGDAALESVIQAALEKLEVVNVTARPGMDLGAVQLAIDCVGETPACLRAVASQTGVQILIAPAIERTDKELVLTLLYFDALGDGELRRVVHRQEGGKLDQATLDAVPGMLRELFGLAAPASAAPAPGAQPETAAQPEGAQAKRPSLLGPLIVGGAGVALLAAGLVAGAVMKGTQSDYAKLPVTTKLQAQAASDKLKSGQGQARAANVLLGVGAAAMALGGIWLALELGKPEETPPQTALAPVLAPGMVGLTFSSRGRGL